MATARAGHVRGLARFGWRPRRRGARLSLAQRFAALCLLILVAGAVVIGNWVSRTIETGVIRRTAAITALYVDSAIRPHLDGRADDGRLRAEATACCRLDLGG